MKTKYSFLIVFLGVLLGVLIAASAQATSWAENRSYFASLHFSNLYFGKKVTAAYAHVGVLQVDDRCGKTGSPYWSEVHHVPLSAKGNHFFGAAILRVSLSECAPRDLGPIVQYWVYFEDGSFLTTDPLLLPVTESRVSPEAYRGAIIEQEKRLKGTEDSEKSEAEMVSSGYAS